MSSILFEDSADVFDHFDQGKAKEILLNHDLSAILLLLRYWPYSDKSLFESVSRTWQDPFINALLVKVGAGD